MTPSRQSHLLTLNGGSSSIKFSVFEVGDPLVRLLKGSIEGIGTAKGSLTVHGSHKSDEVARTVALADHAGAVRLLMAWLHISQASRLRLWVTAWCMAGRILSTQRLLPMLCWKS